jgi:CHAT domain-containing protein/Tfp pilus assembly protein PilF
VPWTHRQPVNSTGRFTIVAAAILSLVLLVCVSSVAHAREGGGARAAWEKARDEGEDLVAKGEFPRATAAFERAAGLARDGNLRPEDALLVLGRLAFCAASLCDITALRDVLRRKLAIEKDVARKSPDDAAAARDVGDTLMDLGYLASVFGSLAEADALLREADEVHRRLGHEVGRALARARLSRVETGRGRYAQALAHAEWARDILRSQSDREEDLGDVLVQLGNIHHDLGDYERAKSYFEEGLELAPKDDLLRAADGLANIGDALCCLGKPDEALERLKEPLALYQENSDSVSEALVLCMMGDAHAHDLNRSFRIALACYGAAASAARDHPVPRARALLEKGRTLVALGRPEEALEDFRLGLDAARSIADLDRQGGCRAGMAVAYLAKGDVKSALPSALDALEFVRLTTGGLTALTGARARGHRAAIFDAALRVAFAQARPAQALNIIEQTRAASLLMAIGGRDALRGTGSEAKSDGERKARETVVTGQAQYELARASRDREKIAAARDALRDAQREYGRLIDRGMSRDTVAPDLPPVALSDLQKALNPEDAMVMYAFAGDRLHALVIRRRAPRTRLVDLGLGSEIRAELQRVRSSLAPKRPPPDCTALKRRLIAALGLESGVRRLLIGPHGPLAHVPFRLLLDDDVDVVLIPSATTFAQLRKMRSGECGKTVLAFGDPDYSREYEGMSLRVYAGGQRLRRLPMTGKEVKAICGPGDAMRLRGDATEAALRKALGKRHRWRSLHFACHGILDRRRPAWSSLALTPGGGDDGFLTVIEILGMRARTDLAVLSGCETGLGKPVQGEGTLGLASAFMYAGATRVLVSLWVVDDAATQALMHGFYQRWNPRGKRTPEPAATALRHAQQEVRKMKGWEHPRFWAGWQIWGLPD